jgi:hypothetical protein
MYQIKQAISKYFHNLHHIIFIEITSYLLKKDMVNYFS